MTRQDEHTIGQWARVGGRMLRRGYVDDPTNTGYWALSAVGERVMRANRLAEIEAGEALLIELAHPEWPILRAAWPIDPVAPWHPSDDAYTADDEYVADDWSRR